MSRSAAHFLIVGAGAAGLMAARELARAGKKVTVLEARERCGGRIYSLPGEQFGDRAEGGPEFVHGDAPVTTAVLREAGLSLVPVAGSRWSVRAGVLSPTGPRFPHADRLRQALAKLKTDLRIAEFLETHFAAQEYHELRRALTRMTEGYDAADPARASTFALRDEGMDEGRGAQRRDVEGHGGPREVFAGGWPRAAGAAPCPRRPPRFWRCRSRFSPISRCLPTRARRRLPQATSAS